MSYELIIIGAGASGLFAAANLPKNIQEKTLILEKTTSCLQKVLSSGGKRCNFTSAIEDTRAFCKNYPRGEKELIGAFKRFSNKDIISWFENKKVPSKIENDFRVFPISDNSEDIVNAILKETSSCKIKYSQEVTKIENLQNQELENQELENFSFCVHTKSDKFYAKKVLISLGGTKSISSIIRSLNINIVKQVPSLFAFSIENKDKIPLSGVSFKGQMKIDKFTASGNCLITHFGFSGPCVLKLSSLSAFILANENYKKDLFINFISQKQNDVFETFSNLRNDIKLRKTKTKIVNEPLFNLPSSLWQYLCQKSGILDNDSSTWSNFSKVQQKTLAENLTNYKCKICARGINKGEFVQAGGVDLKEIDFKTMQSKKVPNLYFAGEVLNIDGVTGGFNLQNAWTNAMIFAQNFNK